MSLKERLQEDLKASMKSKDAIRKSVVTMVRAAIKQIEVDNRVELGDAEILDVITKQLKQRNDSLKDFEKAGREDLIEATKSEIGILKEYLPQQLSEEELEKIVLETISELNARSMKDMGGVMAALKEKTRGIADAKLISQMVRDKLK